MSESASATFQTEQYRIAREARVRNLLRHTDPEQLRGKTILELGCGSGEIGACFEPLGCRVISVDASPAHLDDLARIYPHRERRRVDLDRLDPAEFPGVDIILSFGLFYHLSRPTAHARAVARIAPTLWLETVVCDSDEAEVLMVEETGEDQAASGVGCRPSPAWIELVHEALGYRVTDISSPDCNWPGPYGSVFDWTPRNDRASFRDGCFLRRMYRMERAR